MAFQIGNPTGPNGAYTHADLSVLTDEQFHDLDMQDGVEDNLANADLVAAIDGADGTNDGKISLDSAGITDAINNLKAYLAQNGGFAAVTSTEEGKEKLHHALAPKAQTVGDQTAFKGGLLSTLLKGGGEGDWFKGDGRY